MRLGSVLPCVGVLAICGCSSNAPRPKAETHMLEVHHRGLSVLWTGGREQAEVYAVKLLSAHLLTTLEPAEA